MADPQEPSPLGPMPVELVSTLESLQQRLACEPPAAGGLLWLITPASWHETQAAIRLAEGRGTALASSLRDAEGELPLDGLRLHDLEVVYRVLRLLREPLATSARRVADAYRALMWQLRDLVRERIARREADPQSESLRQAELSWPARESALWQDPLWWRGLLEAPVSPAVVRLALDWTSRSSAEADCRVGPWLRVLLQKVLRDVDDPGLADLLRRLYGDQRERAQLLGQEQESLVALELASLGRDLTRELGLHALPRSEPAFQIPPAEPVPFSRAKVTVLIPAYNHERYVQAAILSACAQTVGEVRILVVDDCSRDATAARASAVADPRIEVRVNSSNLGLGESVARALETVDTPFVALLNSDDLFHPQRLERCLPLLESGASQIVATGLALVDADGLRLTPADVSRVLHGQQTWNWVQWFEGVRPGGEIPSDSLFARLLSANFLVSSSNVVARTDYLRSQAGNLHSLRYCLDWQLFLDAARAGVLTYLPAALLAYRLHFSNTVWFDPEGLQRYRGEVQQVALAALRRWSAGRSAGERGAATGENGDLAENLAANSELDLPRLIVQLLGADVTAGAQAAAGAFTGPYVTARERWQSAHEAAQREEWARMRGLYVSQRILYDDITALGDELSVRREDISALHGEIAARYEEISDLHNRNSDLHNRNSDLRAELDNLRLELMHKEADIERLLNTLSWRVTAPLRKVWDRFHRPARG